MVVSSRFILLNFILNPDENHLIRYTDGTGGCNGCLDNHNMGIDKYHKCTNSPFDFDGLPNFNQTDNAGLEMTADILEEIFTNPNFPRRAPFLPVSLADSGKSRADLWNFAQTVAVEFGIEENNRLCDEVRDKKRIFSQLKKVFREIPQLARSI